MTDFAIDDGKRGKAIPLDQIVASLKDMQRTQYTKETEWLFEKTQLQQKVAQLEGMLRGQENINEDLVKRIKMLEFCLREERVKYARLLNSGELQPHEDIVATALQKANINTNLYERIAKRRAKAQKPLLLK
jgi:striatin 1/3/4